jgi:hypothetical protein
MSHLTNKLITAFEATGTTTTSVLTHDSAYSKGFSEVSPPNRSPGLATLDGRATTLKMSSHLGNPSQYPSDQTDDVLHERRKTRQRAHASTGDQLHNRTHLRSRHNKLNEEEGRATRENVASSWERMWQRRLNP